MSFGPPTIPVDFGQRERNEKQLQLGTHRTRALQDTVDRVLERSEVLGLTRLSDITDLDILGIPNYAAICPKINYPARSGCISVFSGKGMTRLHATASALMEAVERYTCLMNGRHLIRGSFTELYRRFNVHHPSSFIVPGSYEYKDNQVIEWIQALSIFHNDVVLVPAHLAFTPYIPTDPGLPLAYSSTNGLASGNTIEEAALHAIYEAIERDAEMIAEYSGRIKSVNLDSVSSPEVKELVDRFKVCNIQLHVKEITQDIPVPTFLATCVDWETNQSRYINGGKGTHLDPEVALIRAITECSQSRVIGIAGIREDMMLKSTQVTNIDFKKMYEENRFWYEPSGELMDFSDCQDRATTSVMDDLNIILDMLHDASVEDVCVLDMTRPELGIPVARVCIPGLEYKTEGNWIGPRAMRYYNSGLD